MILCFDLKSFDFEVVFDLLIALSSFLQTFDGSFSSLYLSRIELSVCFREYKRWKQSMSEMAASLATSGSICFPMGDDLSTLKFCRSVLHCWLALIEVTSRSNLG
jgi:hypothetical protein